MLEAGRLAASTGCDGVLARISLGSVVAGNVTRSIVSTRCRVGANAMIRDSVLLPGAVVGDGCVLDKAIVDCRAGIARNTRLGPR